MELNKKNVKKILLMITFALVLFWGLMHLGTIGGVLKGLVKVLSPFIIGLCAAFIVSVLLRPIERFWRFVFKKAKRKWVDKLRRPICIFVSLILIFGVIFILVFIVVPELETTFTMIVDMFPTYMQKIMGWWHQLVVFLEKYGVALPEMEVDVTAIVDKLTALLSSTGPTFLDKTVGFASSVFSGLFNFLMGIVFSIYVLVRKEALAKNFTKALQALLSEKWVGRILEVASLSHRTFSKFITGQLASALITGVLCFICMLIFRMPYAPVVSVVVGFTAIIPILGAYIGTFLGAFLILMVSPLKAIGFVVLIVVLQQVEGNLIYPKVVGKSVGLPGIWVLTAVTLGGGLFGITGMLISVPTFTVVYTLVKRYLNKRLKKKGIEEMDT